MSSILDCIRGKVTNALYDEIADQFDTFVRQSMGDTAAANRLLADWLPLYRDNFKRARLNNALASARIQKSVDSQLNLLNEEWAALNPAARKWEQLMGRTEPTVANAYERLLSNTDFAAQQGANELLGELSVLYQKAAPKGLMLDTDRSLMKDVVTGLIDGADKMKNADAKQVAKELREVLDRAATSYRQAGGIIGDVKNYVPIRHNAGKIANVSFEEWFPAYREMTNINKVVDYRTGKRVNEARFKEIAQDMYNDIVSDGATRVARQMKATKKTVRFKNPDMFSRRMQQRMSAPKNAEAFHKYNAAFGVEDEGMFDLIMSNLESIGRDTGVMRVMGAMPYAQGEHMARNVIAQGGTKRDVKRLEGLFRTLVGHWDGSVDTMLSRGVTNLHNVVSSSLLGAASVAAIGDRVFIKNTMRLHGLIGANDLDAWFKTLSLNPDDLVQSLHIAEALAHTNVSRFDGAAGMTPSTKLMSILNNLKNLNHRLSGLQQITLATGDVLTMSFFGDMGTMVRKGLGWGDIDPNFQKLLRRFEIDEADWGRMLAEGVDARGFVTPQMLPDDMSEVARKLNQINLQLRNWATNSPDLRQRMWTTGNRFGSQTRGDVAHLLSSTVLQFKSFPMQVWRNHFVPNMTRALGGDITPMATMMATGMMYGAVIVQLKELLKGNEMYDWLDHELYLRSFVQFGGAGIVGDTMFKDPNAYGRSVVEEWAGPGIGATTGTAMEVWGAMWNLMSMNDDTNINWNAVIRSFKPYVPGGTMWYLRAAIDHMFWDTAVGAIDDDYYKNALKQQQNMLKERGGTGWWGKGEFLPEGVQ